MTTLPRANVPAAVADATIASRWADGPGGNERLTAWAGAALLLGFGAELVTLLNVHWWLTAHIMIGLALVPPTAVKVLSTGYRFARYYTHAPAYRHKGPPHPLLRVLAPVLVLATASLLLSGIGLMVVDTYHHALEELHELSFWTWIALAGVHVLAYVWRVPRLVVTDLRARGAARRATGVRFAAVTGSGLAGIGLALAALPWVRAWISG